MDPQSTRRSSDKGLEELPLLNSNSFTVFWLQRMFTVDFSRHPNGSNVEEDPVKKEISSVRGPCVWTLSEAFLGTTYVP